MRRLANENVPGPLVRSLREIGHDVVWAKESYRGAKDLVVLDSARTEGRLLVTFDKDFGELAFRSGIAAPAGVVLFRLSGGNPDVDNARALDALQSRNDWPGHFAVVEDDRIRIRPLPVVS